jgi:hypothetical protein
MIRSTFKRDWRDASALPGNRATVHQERLSGLELITMFASGITRTDTLCRRHLRIIRYHIEACSADWLDSKFISGGQSKFK